MREEIISIFRFVYNINAKLAKYGMYCHED